MHNLLKTEEKLLTELYNNHPGMVWVSATQYGPELEALVNIGFAKNTVRGAAITPAGIAYHLASEQIRQVADQSSENIGPQADSENRQIQMQLWQ